MARRPHQPPARSLPGTSWPLPLIEVAAGAVLYRLTRLHFPDPAYFGRAALFRFDAPDHSFGVCYLGTSLDCCLLEVVTPTYRATAVSHLVIARVIIARAQLGSYYAATATVMQPLRLAHLADEGLVQLVLVAAASMATHLRNQYGPSFCLSLGEPGPVDDTLFRNRRSSFWAGMKREPYLGRVRPSYT